jgi:hypothetical protein
MNGFLTQSTDVSGKVTCSNWDSKLALDWAEGLLIIEIRFMSMQNL